MAILPTEMHGINQGHSELNSRRLVVLYSHQFDICVQRISRRNQNNLGQDEKKQLDSHRGLYFDGTILF